MTDVYSRTTKIVRHEQVIPMGPLGWACWNEVTLAIRYAIQELTNLGFADSEPSDDQIRVEPRDEEIVVYWEEKSGGQHG